MTKAKPQDMSELIERLLQIRGTQFTPTETALVTEAAEAIQSQQAEIDTLENQKLVLEQYVEASATRIAALEAEIERLREGWEFRDDCSSCRKNSAQIAQTKSEGKP